ncbi:LysR family transcriptional regulator [Stigmatella aurantiaca]|nr:LysR family transcriptional regulator [Stigmatella aurantiaca]
MGYMHPVQLSSIDTNLLVVLDALLQEGHVGRASKRVALSPSATSHALARLRELLGDELLVRAGRQLVLTPRAIALAPQVRQLMEQMERILRPAESFHPAKLEHTFRVLTTDHIEFVLLRPLDRFLTDEAPRVILHNRPMVPDAVEELRGGRADLAFGVFTDLPDDISSQELFKDRFVTLVREGHPVLARPLTLKRFAELDHVLVAPRGTATSRMDLLLAERNLKRRVVRTLGSFLSAPFFVAQSDHAVTLSARIADALAPLLGLRVLEPPIAYEYTLTQIWHRRWDADPAHAWLRQLTARVASGLPALRPKAAKLP